MTPRFVLTFCCISLTGVGLYFAPDAAVSRVRGTITDAIRPGQILFHRAMASILGRLSESGSATDNDVTERLKDELSVERERNRALQTRLAQVTEQYQGEQDIRYA